jgi:hypothetical protein
VHDVVSVQPSPLRAEWVGAALVAAGEVAAGGPVGRAFGRVDADEPSQPVGEHLDPGVARQELGDRVGQDGAELELGGAEGAVGIDVVVQHHQGAVAGLAGAGNGRVEGVDGGGGHAHQAVGPGRVPCAVGLGERVRIGGGVGIEVVTVAELGVSGSGERDLQHGALVGREAEVAAQPAVGPLANPARALGRGRRPIGAVGLVGQRPQKPVELRDQQKGRQCGDLGVAGGGNPPGDADHGVFAQAALAERRPARGQLAGPPGDADQPLGAVPGHARLPGDPVLGRLDARPHPPAALGERPRRLLRRAVRAHRRRDGRAIPTRAVGDRGIGHRDVDHRRVGDRGIGGRSTGDRGIRIRGIGNRSIRIRGIGDH